MDDFRTPFEVWAGSAVSKPGTPFFTSLPAVFTDELKLCRVWRGHPQ